MCHDPSWRKASAKSALMKVHFGKDPHDLTLGEMKKIEQKHGPDWHKDLGLEDNPLYHNSELSIRKTQW